MAENPNDFVDYATLAWRTADVAQKAGLFGWLKQRVAREPQDSHDWQAEAIEALRLNAVDCSSDLPHSQWSKRYEYWGQNSGQTTSRSSTRVGNITGLPVLAKWRLTTKKDVAGGPRILAGEIRQPGSFSLRTLAAMDVLSTAEARLFSKLAAYVWTGPARPHPVITPDEGSGLWVPDVADRSVLQAAGLLAASDLTWSLPMKQGSRYHMVQGQTRVVLTVNEDFDMRCSNCKLTEAGEELWTLTSPTLDPTYHQGLLETWQKHCTVILR